MGSEYYVLIIGYIFGFYMAWNIGANDVANSMASAVGARAITIRQAIFIAGILNIVGAVFIGSDWSAFGTAGGGAMGVFRHLEIAAGIHDALDCGRHDRLWHHGRRVFSDQLGQTGCGGLELGDFPGICHGHRLFDV